MARLSLSLLGTFQVTLDRKPIHHFRVNTARALLAYLAVEADRPHHRDTLAGLLWPDIANAAALNNLRHALSDLRRAISDSDAAPFLHITRHTLQFNLASDSWIDVHAFLSDAQADEAAQQTAVVALYRGPFLDGFALNASPAFEEWLLVRQQQYAQQIIDMLRRLINDHIQQGAYHAAQQQARRLLELEPWHEDAHSLLMEALALDGRRTEALAQYNTYCRLVAQELGALPSPNLTAQYERLRLGQTITMPMITPVTPPAARSLPPFVVARPNFVAREAELVQLATTLNHARAGSGQIVFIAGEAGSGKTTLIDEFIRQALLAHGDVLAASGTCSAHTGPGDPYLPVRAIMQLLTGDIEAKRASGAITPEHARRLWDSLPNTLQILVEHGPDLLGSFVNTQTLALRAEAFASPSTRWRERLSELAQQVRSVPQPTSVLMQFTAVLHALTHLRPLILVLDDLQWADEATLNWLFHLSRHLNDTPCLIIGAYRPADIALGRAGQRHPLKAIINELQRTLGDIQINLDRSSGRAFVDALLNAEPNDLSAEFRDTLFQHTGGNALFTVELISGMKARGELVRNEQKCWVTGAALNWEIMPVRVEAVIAERIDRAPAQWQTLLDAAGVAGGEFSAEVVANAIGLETSVVTHALNGELNQHYQLVAATRLEWSGTRRLTYYRFRHHLFEKYLYQRLDEVRRAQLHEAIGTALEKQYSDRPSSLPTIAAQLARQFETAGLMLKAAEYWRLAGQRAMRLSAYPEAVATVTHGLALLDDLPVSPERMRCELNLQLALGEALLSQGWGTAERARVFDRAYQLALQTDTTIDFLCALYALAGLALGKREIAQSLTFGQELLRLAEQADAREQIIQAHYLIGAGQCIAGQLTMACQHLEQVLALTETTTDDLLIGPGRTDLRVNCLGWLLLAHWMKGEVAQAEIDYQMLLERTHQVDQPMTLGIALTVSVCPMRLLRGELAEAQQPLTVLNQLAGQYAPLFRPWVNVFAGYVRVQQGDRAGLAQLQQGIAAWEATGTRGGYVVQRLLLMQACTLMGEIKVGLQTAAEVVAQIEQYDWRMYEAEVRRVQGELWQACGDYDQARACFEAALEVAYKQDAGMWERRAARSLRMLVTQIS